MKHILKTSLPLLILCLSLNASAQVLLDSSGNVGIGTLDPQTTLHISGSLSVEDGSQKDGAVLTSDANGKATWKTPANGLESITYATQPNFACSGITGTDTVSLNGRSVEYANGIACVLSSNALELVDVSDPNNPVRVNSIGSWSSGLDMILSGDKAIILDNDSVFIIDIINPLTPVVETMWPIPGSPWCQVMESDGNHLFIGAYSGIDSKVRLLTVDVSDPSSVTQVSDVVIASNTSTLGDMAIDGDHLYVTVPFIDSLFAFDISTPSSPENIGSFSPGPGLQPDKLTVSAGKAYVALYDSLSIVDVSDPGAMNIASKVAAGYVLDIASAGDFAFVVDNGGQRLVIVNAGQLNMPQIAEVVSMPANVYPYNLGVYGNYAYLYVSGDLIDELMVIRTSCIQSLSVDPYSGEVTQQKWSDLNEVLATGNNGGGFRITNISDPTDPQDAATKAYVDMVTGNLLPSGEAGSAALMYQAQLDQASARLEEQAAEIEALKQAIWELKREISGKATEASLHNRNN